MFISFQRELTDRPAPTNPLLHIARNRHVFWAALMSAVICEVVSATQSARSPSPIFDEYEYSTSASGLLHEVSIIIFLVLTIFQAVQTLILIRMEIAGKPIIIQRNLVSF